MYMNENKAKKKGSITKSRHTKMKIYIIEKRKQNQDYGRGESYTSLCIQN